MDLTLYHNPRCSKSRATLALLEERGIRPDIVLYLEEPPSAGTVLALAKALNRPVRDLLRSGEDEFKAARDTLDLEDDRALAAWLAGHPRVLQRPIAVVQSTGRAAIGRPPEAVLELLDS